MEVEIEEEEGDEEGDEHQGNEVVDEEKGLRELPAAKRPIAKNKQVQPNQNLGEGIHAVQGGWKMPIRIHCHTVAGERHVRRVELARAN